jgi:hypothetical protein
MRVLLLLFLGFLAGSSFGQNLYTIEFNSAPNAPDQIMIMELTFLQKLPPPDDIDRLLRVALEVAIKIDGSRDIQAYAFEGDSTLRPPNFSGPLFYKSVVKKILTEDEFHEFHRTK